jgi:hypothetical protein
MSTGTSLREGLRTSWSLGVSGCMAFVATYSLSVVGYQRRLASASSRSIWCS